MARVPNGKHKGSVTRPGVVVLDSSDSGSESEGFVEELTPVHSKSNGKASSGSLKTGGKGSSFSKGEASQGKAYSGGKGGKGSSSNVVPTKSDAELKLELDIPPNSKMLMNCEAAELLQEIHEHMAILSEDPKIKIPESFDKAFQYAKDGNHFRTASSVKQALEYPLFIKAIEQLLEVTSYYRVVSIRQACMLAVQFLDLLL
jgi:DNA-directed RNA polymerase II subunit RPB4